MVFEMLGHALRLLRRSVACRGFGGTLGLIFQMSFRRRTWSRRWKIDYGNEFDRNHGTDTGAAVVQTEGLDVASSNWIHGIRYSPTPEAKLHEMFAALPIRHEEFTFIDFGSGKGKVLLLASELPFKAIIGLEFSPQLHQAAQQNVASYRSQTQACKHIECVLVDAALYDVPLVPVVCYFYNPFRGPIIEQVLSRLENSLQLAPRQIFVVYYHPLFQHLFSASKCFGEIRVKDDYRIYKSRAGL